MAKKTKKVVEPVEEVLITKDNETKIEEVINDTKEEIIETETQKDNENKELENELNEEIDNTELLTVNDDSFIEEFTEEQIEILNKIENHVDSLSDEELEESMSEFDNYSTDVKLQDLPITDVINMYKKAVNELSTKDDIKGYFGLIMFYQNNGIYFFKVMDKDLNEVGYGFETLEGAKNFIENKNYYTYNFLTEEFYKIGDFNETDFDLINVDDNFHDVYKNDFHIRLRTSR